MTPNITDLASNYTRCSWCSHRMQTRWRMWSLKTLYVTPIGKTRRLRQGTTSESHSTAQLCNRHSDTQNGPNDRWFCITYRRKAHVGAALIRGDPATGCQSRTYSLSHSASEQRSGLNPCLTAVFSISKSEMVCFEHWLFCTSSKRNSRSQNRT